MIDRHALHEDLQRHVVGTGADAWIHAHHVHDADLQANALAAGVTAAELANTLHIKARARAYRRLLAGDWQGYLDEFGRFFKVEALGKLYEYSGTKPFAADKRFGSDVSEPTRYVFDQIGGHRDHQFWAWALATLRRSGQSLMTPEERQVFAELPQEITIYRGGVVSAGADLMSHARGFWWTQDRSYAATLAIHLRSPGRTIYLARTTLPKEATYGFLSGHYANPVIADPSRLPEIELEPVAL